MMRACVRMSMRVNQVPVDGGWFGGYGENGVVKLEAKADSYDCCRVHRGIERER